MTSLSAQFPGFEFWEPNWQQFVAAHSGWINERHSEGLELFYIPSTQEIAHGLTTLFGLTQEDLNAENAFAVLCQRFHACGVELHATATHPDVRLIRFDGLDPWLPIPDDSFLELGRNFGWPDEMIARAKVALAKMDALSDRLPAIAGRLCCHPHFRSERDALRTAWLALPVAERPTMPLQRSRRIPSDAALRELRDELGIRRASSAASQFQQRVDQFLEEWQLLSLETWELPKPQGPHWPDFRVPSDQTGTTILSTPARFPVLESDDIGRPARERHQREASECGIDDEARWRTYAEILRVGVWESILQQRYVQRDRNRRFITELLFVLGDVVGLSNERIQRLRKIRSSLISGRRTSLTDIR